MIAHVLQLSYSPNLGELTQNGSQNVFYLFPSQMDATAIAAVLDFFGWRRVAVVTEENGQIAVSGPWNHFCSVKPSCEDNGALKRDPVDHVPLCLDHVKSRDHDESIVCYCSCPSEEI